MSRRREQRPPRSASPADRQVVEVWSGEEWVVRQVTGAAATKHYRCPGCDHLIAMATPHVVAWPAEPGVFAESGLEERRHWHTGCWRARERRHPRP
ncbi:MAG: hypothetical protein ACRDO1_08495 [Nocardioidaceae bacterium]